MTDVSATSGDSQQIRIDVASILSTRRVSGSLGVAVDKIVHNNRDADSCIATLERLLVINCKPMANS